LDTIDNNSEHIIYKRVVIKKDQTPLEREEMKKLLEQRDKMREESRQRGEADNWIIWRGRVVRSRHPTHPE
jgi:hypothetical protein